MLKRNHAEAVMMPSFLIGKQTQMLLWYVTETVIFPYIEIYCLRSLFSHVVQFIIL